MTNDALQRSHDKNLGKPSVLGRKTVMRRLLLCTTLCALYLFAVSTYPMAQGLDPSRTPSMAGTPSTEETANLDPLDFKSAMPFISDDGVIEIQLPAGWRPDNPSRNGYYGFSYTARPNDKANTTVAFVIVLGNLGDIYNVLTGRTDPAIDSPETLLAELKNTLPVTISSGDVQRAKIGKLHAFSLETYGPALQLASATTQIRVTRLPTGSAVAVVFSAPALYWDKVTRLINSMLDSLNINAGKLPTLTPTPTATVSPTPTQTAWPTQTLSPALFTNLDPFNMDQAVTVHSDDGVVELKLPAGWFLSPSDRWGYYAFLYYAHPGNYVMLEINVGTLLEINSRIAIPNPPLNSPREYLDALRTWLLSNKAFDIGAIQKIGFGELSGYRMDVHGPLFGQPITSHSEVRIAQLPGGSSILIILLAPDVLWSRTAQLTDKMLDTLQLKLNLLPSKTPTATAQ